MSRKQVRGAALPDKNPDVYWVVSIDGGKKERFTVYSPQVWGVWTHYHLESKKTTPCYENEKKCFGGHDPRTLRWKGYLFVRSFDMHRNVFLQLTKGGADDLVEQLGPDVQLRGLTIDVKRTASKQGRLYVSIADYIVRDARTFPADLDPRTSLYNVWKIPDPGHRFNPNPTRHLVEDGEWPEDGSAIIHSGVG